MKKIFRLLAALFAFAIIFAVFTACTGAPCECEPIDTEIDETITVIIGEWRFEDFTTYSNTIGEVLDELAEIFWDFTFEYTSFGWGRQIDVLGDLSPGAGEFIAIYLTSTNLRYANPLQTRVVNGVEFRSSHYGADSLPVLGGVTYMFVVVAW